MASIIEMAVEASTESSESSLCEDATDCRPNHLTSLNFQTAGVSAMNYFLPEDEVPSPVRNFNASIQTQGPFDVMSINQTTIAKGGYYAHLDANDALPWEYILKEEGIFPDECDLEELMIDRCEENSMTACKQAQYHSSNSSFSDLNTSGTTTMTSSMHSDTETEEIPAHKNCSLRIYGIPFGCDIVDILTSFSNTGRIYDIEIDDYHPSSGAYSQSATITFSTRRGAERFYDFANLITNPGLRIGERYLTVRWSALRSRGNHPSSNESRKMLIEGPAGFACFEYIKRHCDSHCDLLHTDDDVLMWDNTVKTWDGSPCVTIEFSGIWYGSRILADLIDVLPEFCMLRYCFLADPLGCTWDD